MADEFWDNAGKGLADNEVAFDYIKSTDFRVVWADGGVGGLTPQGLVHVAFYAERPAIPRRQVHTINTAEDGSGALGNELLEKRISRGSIVREMACDVFMSPQSAASLGQWLLDQAEELRKISQSKETP